MFIAPVDATRGEGEWRPFLESHPFGHLVVPGGPDRDLPVVVPTQFVLQGDTAWLHLVRANPVFGALAESPRVLASRADVMRWQFWDAAHFSPPLGTLVFEKTTICDSIGTFRASSTERK